MAGVPVYMFFLYIMIGHNNDATNRFPHGRHRSKNSKVALSIEQSDEWLILVDVNGKLLPSITLPSFFWDVLSPTSLTNRNISG